jgi:hypothetical protein
MSLKPEAQIIFDKLKIYPRFFDEFRQAELWVYQQRERIASKTILNYKLKQEVINNLVNEGIIEKIGLVYELKNINQEAFIKAVNEEKILIKELSFLRFGEIDEAQVEALELILERFNDKQGFVDKVLNNYKKHEPLVPTLLKEYLMIPKQINITYPPELKGQELIGVIEKQLELVKPILKEEVAHRMDRIQMIKVLSENDNYITESKNDIKENFKKTYKQDYWI